MSEQQLKSLFNTDNEFNDLKINYDILYQNYMHRSHTPFNTVFGMEQQDAGDNFWPWNISLSDDRPHRDIFYNHSKDFEKINTQRKQSSARSSGRNGTRKQKKSPKYKVLNSIEWNDPA